MKPYLNLSGDSGIVAYSIGADFIRIRFRGSEEIYTYSHASAGRGNIQEMKRLARSGKGLATFISREVRDQYESKE
jgi:hypothetical protein